jgi:type II secretory pathway pseudopilin PulG
MTRAKESGFTLIELTILLAGAILVGSVFLPAVQSEANQNVRCETATGVCVMPVGETGGK